MAITSGRMSRRTYRFDDDGKPVFVEEVEIGGDSRDTPLRWFEQLVAQHTRRGEKLTIEEATELACARFPQLTRRQFYLRVWSVAAPEAWQKGGAPKGPRKPTTKPR